MYQFFFNLHDCTFKKLRTRQQVHSNSVGQLCDKAWIANDQSNEVLVQHSRIVQQNNFQYNNNLSIYQINMQKFKFITNKLWNQLETYMLTYLLFFLPSDHHCVKNTCIRLFSGPYFPVLGLNLDIYFVNLCVQFECSKIWATKLLIWTNFMQCTRQVKC